MLTPSSDAAAIIDHLSTLRSEENIAGMARFGISTETALGISNPALQKIARLVKRDHARALALWRSGIREARMVAIYTADPKILKRAEAHSWADDFTSWEIVDTAADLFTELPLWQDLIAEFAADEREFIRRTGAAVHRKMEPDDTFISYLPLIERHSSDTRNFVRKAVNWSLRNIGKRSRTCHAPAPALSERLAASDDRTARWIGRDAMKELASEKVLNRLKP
jgi:3-methyladenine DNA glycosylase AlkD